MAIERTTRPAHPLLKAAVIGAGALLVVLVAMSAVSALEGVVWTLIKIALVVALVAGVTHLLRRR